MSNFFFFKASLKNRNLSRLGQVIFRPSHNRALECNSTLLFDLQIGFHPNQNDSKKTGEDLIFFHHERRESSLDDSAAVIYRSGLTTEI